ncbi:MAG: hypothetical protein ACI9CQ_001527 [Saprospiraceae bacterium]|jgi:hypothetical protein
MNRLAGTSPTVADGRAGWFQNIYTSFGFITYSLCVGYDRKVTGQILKLICCCCC